MKGTSQQNMDFNLLKFNFLKDRFKYLKKNIYLKKKVMQKLFYIFSLIFLSNFTAKAQTPEFEEPVVLTDIIISFATVFNTPIIPWDYNNDNRVDFIGVNSTDFIEATETGYKIGKLSPTTFGPPVAIVDFDKNGTLDLVKTTAIVFNNGDGTISLVKHGILHEFIAGTADFDKNGYTDYVTGYFDNNFSNGNLKVWFNNGDKTFSPLVLNDNSSSQNIDVDDYDKNGYPDIIATGKNTKEIYFMQANKTYEKRGFDPSLNFAERCMESEDIDNDTYKDLVVYIDSVGFSTIKGKGSLFENKLGPVLSCKEMVTYQCTDLNGDGKYEVLFIYKFNDRITVAYSTINNDFSFGEIVNLGSFAPFPESYYKGIGNYFRRNLSLYDIDLDGKKDIIYSDAYNLKIQFFKNLTPVGTNDPLSFALSSIEYYPNPAVNELSIDLGDKIDRANYAIFSLKGELLKKSEMVSGINKVDVGFLPAGNYLMTIESCGEQKSIQFVKI